MVRQLYVTRIRLEKEQKNVIPVESEGDDVFISSGVTLPTVVSDSGTGTERTVSNSSPSKRITEQQFSSFGLITQEMLHLQLIGGFHGGPGPH